MPYSELDKYICDAVLIIGQPDLPVEMLQKVKKLREIINVETNFVPNVDNEYCFKNGVHVLTPGSAFAPVVGELSLGKAIDLARGITASDHEFRRCSEKYGLDSNTDSFSLFGATIGIVGYGDLGRQLHELIKPFGGKVKVFDPWLPKYIIENRCGAKKTTLEDLLATSRVIFVFASVSSENAGCLNAEKLKLVRSGSVFLLMSRAAVVNWNDLVAESGRLKIGTDVYPSEPLCSDDSARTQLGLLSAHRAGALVDALYGIGDQTVSDALTILAGLPPTVCRRAQLETVRMSRSKPVDKT